MQQKLIPTIFIYLFALVCLYSQPSSLQTKIPVTNGFSAERLARIDTFLNALVASEEIPGAVVFISRKGKTVMHKAYGYKDNVDKTLLKRNDIFRIASQTKAITSLAVMMLWEEGRFGLDDPVHQFMPEFKNPQVLKSFNPQDSSYTTEPAGKEITIRHLLTHTSGIDYAAIGSREFNAIYAKAGVPSGIGNDKDILEEKMKILAKLPLKHKPGEKFTYSLSTDVLGYLVEVVSGMSLDAFFRKRIFEPLNMNDSYFYVPAAKRERVVPMYDGNSGKAVKMKEEAFDGVDPDYPKLNGTYFSGGAGLSSTVEDYAKFLQLFINQGTYNGRRLISRKTVELMLTNQMGGLNASPFGLGFGLETDTNDHLSVLTPGSFSWGGAFNTHYWADPKENLVALIYTNIYRTKQWSIGERFKILTYQAISD